MRDREKGSLLSWISTLIRSKFLSLKQPSPQNHPQPHKPLTAAISWGPSLPYLFDMLRLNCCDGLLGVLGDSKKGSLLIVCNQLLTSGKHSLYLAFNPVLGQPLGSPRPLPNLTSWGTELQQESPALSSILRPTPSIQSLHPLDHLIRAQDFHYSLQRDKTQSPTSSFDQSFLLQNIFNCITVTPVTFIPLWVNINKTKQNKTKTHK